MEAGSSGLRDFEVLLVEDDSADVLMAREAFESVPRHVLNVVPDGSEAMAYLRREGPYREVSRPDLVLLDLNLPKVSGRQVLADVKGDPYLRVIPVVILSTSGTEEDIVESYRLHANAYVVKPVDFNEFSQSIRFIGDFFPVHRPDPALPGGPAELTDCRLALIPRLHGAAARIATCVRG